MSYNLFNTLREPQKEIFLDTSRFRVVVAGRRFGKTKLAVIEALYAAQRKPNQLIWYVAPTYMMAKDLAWEELKALIPPQLIANKNEAELSITLKYFNSKIVLKGANNRDSLRGKGLDFVILDEAADIHKNTWFEVLFPALADKLGSALFIGTPKGYNWFYDLYLRAEDNLDGKWSAYSFTTEQGGNVTPEEIEYAKHNLSPEQFKQEYQASFENLSNRVYSCFSRENNVDSGVEDIGKEILIGMDFNINPMSCVIGSRITNQLHIFDEIAIENGNTEEISQEIKRRYKDRNITIYPDPSGRSRKTSSPVGQTDFSILKYNGFKVIAPSKAPLVVDRINEVNALCRNAYDVKRLFIHPKCRHLIKSFEGLTYKLDTSLIDKASGLDHMADAIGYLIHSEFPIIKKDLKRLKIVGL